MSHYSEAIRHLKQEAQMKQCFCIGPQNGDSVCQCRMPAYREAEAGKMALEWLRKKGRQKRKPRVRVKAISQHVEADPSVRKEGQQP